MKRVLKIFGISLGGVIVGMALIVLFAWIFGAFTEKKIPPEDISFVKEEVVTASAAALRVTTETEKVNQKTLDVTVSPSGILDAPKVVTLDEDFIVWPIKGNDGYNVGGIVTVTASYNGLLVAKCRVKVDVPVDDIVVKTQHASLSKGEQITFSTDVIPARALNPWKTDIIPGDLNLYDEREKTIFYFLYDNSGYLMDTTKAYFYDSGRQVNMLKSTDIDAQTRLVAVQECEFFVKAFCFSTFTREDHYNVQDIEDMKYDDGREQIKEEFINVLKEARSESGNDEGQFISVTDVYIDSFTASDEIINTFLYETTYLTARKAHPGTNEFNLDMKLHPAESSDGYTYENLDSFIDNIVLEWVDGAELKVLKQGTFDEGTPEDWKWSICPTVYSNEALTATLKATINYYDIKTETMATLDWNFDVQVNTRPVAGITANKFTDENGEDKEYISLNSDSPDTDSIKLEEGFVSEPTSTGLLTHSYKYFDVVPQIGYPYSTFSLVKFFLPADTVTRPTTEGNYKITFEFEETARSTSYRMNITDGNIQGDISFFKLNETTGEYEPIAGSPSGENGKYRAELIYKKTNKDMPSFAFYGDGADPMPVTNVLYYEQGSEYPYCIINGVKVKTFFNSDSFVITRQLAEITAEGYGNFNIIASVVVSDNNGSIIYDENGNFRVLTSKTISVRVTNSVKDIKLNVTAGDGTTTGVHQSDFNRTVVLDENAEYYIYIEPGDNTALDVLSQAVAKETFIVEYSVRTERLDDSGVIINNDAFTINSLEEDRDEAGELKGYKFLLEVKNVFSVENSSGETTSILFNITFSVMGTSFIQTNTIEVRDHVLKEANISYGNSSVSQLQIYASNISDGVVQWKERSNSASVDLSNFKFEFSSEYGVVNVAPNITFTPTNSNINTTGLISANPDENGIFKLSLNNFPYINDNGVHIDITMEYGGNDDTINKRYVYDEEHDCYTLKSYDETTANFTLIVFGFKIEYNPRAVDIVGVKDQTVNIIDGTYVNYSIKDAKNSNVASNLLTQMVDFSMVTTEYFRLDGTTITILKSITTPQSITVTLMIGSNNFAQHNLTFKSPYTITAKKTTPIKAPQANVDLKTYFTIKQDTTEVDNRLVKYSLGDSVIERNGKNVSDYVTIAEDGTMVVKYVPYDFKVDVHITIYEKKNADLGFDSDNLESKGTWTDLLIDVVNDYLEHNEVFVGNAAVDGNKMYGDGSTQYYIHVESVYSGNDYELEIAFNNHYLYEKDGVPDTDSQFVYEGKKDINYGYSIYATDIVSEEPKTVEVILHIIIPNNGDTYVKLNVYVYQYLHVEFSRNPVLQSGTSGFSISTENDYVFRDNNGQVLNSSIIAPELLILDCTFSVAEESINLIEIREETEGLTVNAKHGITEEQTAYLVVTRTIYVGAKPMYEVQYRLEITVRPAA